MAGWAGVVVTTTDGGLERVRFQKEVLGSEDAWTGGACGRAGASG